jgi:hypothetical protein
MHVHNDAAVKNRGEAQHLWNEPVQLDGDSEGNHQEGDNEVSNLCFFLLKTEQEIDILFADLDKLYDLQANTERCR